MEQSELKLKKYVSAKIVLAVEMDENTFLRKFKPEVPIVADGCERPNREGYMVIYPDDYKSWSPKQAFDNSHREITVGELDLLVE